MKTIINFLLMLFARVLLQILGLPLLAFGILVGLIGGNGAEYYRMLAIVLDILGCVLGGPTWNFLFFKWLREPEIQFGNITTMSFVFAHNKDNLNLFGLAIYDAIEWVDPGHMEKAKSPKYLEIYFNHWKNSLK